MWLTGLKAPTNIRWAHEESGKNHTHQPDIKTHTFNHLVAGGLQKTISNSSASQSHSEPYATSEARLPAAEQTRATTEPKAFQLHAKRPQSLLHVL